MSPDGKRNDNINPDNAGGNGTLGSFLARTQGLDGSSPIGEDSEVTGEADLALSTLEAQGFTGDEATRLIHVSDRLKTSRESIESARNLRRLEFTRWLIQHGRLSEE